MNQSLLKKTSAVAVILCFMAVGGIFAQQPTPSPKRNSPFSPNPKKKAEPATSQRNVSKNSTPNDVVKIINISDTKSPDQTPQTDESKSIYDEIPANNEVFESRSLAKKTLEVAKRASALEASPTDIYRVGIGDVLYISLQNAPPKESTYFTVLADGNIDYPLAGGMTQVLGLTTDQIEDLLKEKIKLYENPQISIKIREHNSHIFTVLGLAERTGEKAMQREALPLYVVKAESVVSSKANEVVIKRGNSEKKVFDLQDAKTADVLVYPGDIVEFRANTETAGLSRVNQFYFIGGEINSGGKKEFTKGITLTQAILESGGLKKSNVKRVVIRRKNESGMLVPTEYDLKLIKDGKAVDPVLEAGDTIEIGKL